MLHRAVVVAALAVVPLAAAPALAGGEADTSRPQPAAAFSARGVIPSASAACAAAAVRALTDRGYVFFYDYPVALWVQPSTERYVTCLPLE